MEERLESWYKATAKVFARVHKQDVSEVPLDSWKKLIRHSYDNVDINPLYTRLDEAGEPTEPGTFPFVRGARSVEDATDGWGVTETFGAPTEGADVKAINEGIIHGLNVGTTHIVVSLNHGVGADDLADVLAGVELSAAPVRLDGGTNTAAGAEALLALADGVADARLEFGAAPLTGVYDETPTASVEETVNLAQAAAVAAGDVRAVLVDGVSFSNQGASDGQEIGLVLAAAVEYLRLLTEAGMDLDAAYDQLSFRFAATDSQFNTIAKFRAARELWARVGKVVGVGENRPATPQHALTAPAMFTQRDPWVNMLRVTVAAFAAGVGGATDVEILPFDWAIHGGIVGTSDAFRRRIARNTNLLLIEESHLGHVIDPAGGSFFVEDFTDKLADAAWAVFQDVEKQGGLRAAESTVREMLAATAEARRKDIATRKKSVTAINEFPNLGEAPLSPEQVAERPGVLRYSAEFEGLRNRSDAFLAQTGARPLIGLIPLGPLSKHNGRTGWIGNLLGTGGIAVNDPGQVVPGEKSLADAAAVSDIVCICGTDDEYANSGLAAVQELHGLGKKVLIAGSAKSFDGQPDQPDDYLNVKIDAVATLAGLLDELGA
ncbi:MAG: methylmalonyl-CoA mutase family protein [Corynebacterium sp.]|nr:methylmalonyl-CoA mutase family protein [Corynebacterium sp.]